MNRYKVLKRHKVHYVPGWDCHGMPIETKAITDAAGKHIELPALEIRAKGKNQQPIWLKGNNRIVIY